MKILRQTQRIRLKELLWNIGISYVLFLRKGRTRISNFKTEILNAIVLKLLLNFLYLISAIKMQLYSGIEHYDELKLFKVVHPFYYAILADVGSEKAHLFQGVVKKPII